MQNCGRTDRPGKDRRVDLTKEEAEAYMAEMADFELDDEGLKKIAGGIFECYMRHNCGYIGDDWK